RTRRRHREVKPSCTRLVQLLARPARRYKILEEETFRPGPGGGLRPAAPSGVPAGLRPGGSRLMADVTQILDAIERGDPHAAEQLLLEVYDELRRLAAQRLAQEKPGQTLEATALVPQAYLRLLDGGSASPVDSRGRFFAAR